MNKLSAASLSLSAFLYTHTVWAASGHETPAAEAHHTGADGHHTDVAAHGAEHASSGGLPQFDPTWFASQVFWLGVSFAILYLFFSKKTLPDISSVIENRKNHIQADIETAEKLTAQADEVHEGYQADLEKAQAKAMKALYDSEAKMKEKAAKTFDEFRERSEKEMKDAEKRILNSKNAAMNDMNMIAAETASIAIEKIIGTQTDAGAVKALIENIDGKKSAKAA